MPSESPKPACVVHCVGIVGVGQQRDAAALAAQRVHAGARRDVGADQGAGRDAGGAVGARACRRRT